MSPKQAPHKLLAIPGPVECSDEVLRAISQPPVSHVSPQFVSIFKECMHMTRQVLFTKDGLPFIIAGSGTLGWDQVSANLVEPGENVLVLNTGYFGDSFAECLQAYGAHVDQIKADLGAVVPQSTLETALKSRKYKVVAFTHVDTSTGVLSDAKSIAQTVKRLSPESLVVLDGVCSVASEDIRMDDWAIDIVMTASQKGLGAPPGLSILVASSYALKVYETRSAPIASYYASWKKWLPIMKAYDNGAAAYFATPPVNMIYAYHASLKQITSSSPTLEDRFRLHRQASERVRAIASQLGFTQVPREPRVAANGMTALYPPEGVRPSDLLPQLAAEGVVVAGGLHKDIKDKYIRIGHMGVSVTDSLRGDMDFITSSLKKGLAEVKRRGE